VSRIEATKEQLAELAEMRRDGPVTMINLLAFKAQGGAERYEVYAANVQPHLERVGAEIMFVGRAEHQVIGEGARPWWDAVAVVRYPSAEAFLQMVSDPDYLAVHADRAGALERAELIATAPWG
jgi:uncharacterized protein (DUF1330 family)